jgi:hypothetical protein
MEPASLEDDPYRMKHLVCGFIAHRTFLLFAIFCRAPDLKFMLAARAGKFIYGHILKTSLYNHSEILHGIRLRQSFGEFAQNDNYT